MVKVSCKMGGSRLDPVTGGSGSDKSPLPNRVWDVLQLHLEVDPCMFTRKKVEYYAANRSVPEIFGSNEFLPTTRLTQRWCAQSKNRTSKTTAIRVGLTGGPARARSSP
eukprot:m.157056 g.157056  ORF g.157056 m.157056 type:complete len:109 (+) comp23644_c0_seq11:283-609(+)